MLLVITPIQQKHRDLLYLIIQWFILYCLFLLYLYLMYFELKSIAGRVHLYKTIVKEISRNRSSYPQVDQICKGLTDISRKNTSNRMRKVNWKFSIFRSGWKRPD